MRLVPVLSFVLAAVLSATAARAQSVEEFYRGKSISLLIGFSVGGGYDLYARHLARFMGRHIPGKPTIVPQNMAGAGSLRAANFLYSAAPKDGTAIGTFSRTTGINPLLESGATFDGTKFTWLGSGANEISFCATWHTSPVKSWADMLKTSFAVGGEGAGSDPDCVQQTFLAVPRDHERFALGTAQEQRMGARRGEEFVHQLEIRRMRHADHAQRFSLERIDQLRERMRARTHTQPRAQAQQVSQSRREHGGRHECDVAAVERVLSKRKICARHDTEFAQDVRGRNPAVAGERSVNEHRHAEPVQQQREQRQKIRLVPRTVVTRQHDGLCFAGRRPQAKQALAHRAVEAEQFGQRFGFHP